MLFPEPGDPRPIQLPRTRELVRGAWRPSAASSEAAIAARRGSWPASGAVRALAAAARLCWLLRRVRRDPAAPSVLEGRFYADPDLTRELRDMVTRLVEALAGASGLDRQEAAIDALRTAYRRTPAPGQLITAAHVFDLLDPSTT